MKLFLSSLCLAVLSEAQLPHLNVNTSGITVSGISSGADFAVQFHIAFSSVIHGVGVFAGQPRGCAVMRFPNDTLVPACNSMSNCSVPICQGCPNNMTIEYDHCKWASDRVVPELLLERTQQDAKKGLIDDVTNMRMHPVYIYRGTRDGCYKVGAEERLIEYYRYFVGDGGGNDGGLIAYEASIPSLHAQPTIHQGSPCGGPYDGPYSYLANCGYDGAGAVLKHMYGRETPLNSAGQANLSNLLSFDQRPFFPAVDAGLADNAYVYIPTRCHRGGCRLHVWFHGCGGPDRFYNASVHFAGFNEWAETNDIIILYPAMRKWGRTHQEQSGCWDGYGQTGADYVLQTGLQMGVIRRMLAHLSEDLASTLIV